MRINWLTVSNGNFFNKTLLPIFLKMSGGSTPFLKNNLLQRK